MSLFRAEILACVRAVLGPEARLGDGSTLFAAGRLDSIVSVELLSRLDEHFQVSLDEEEFFAARSLEELASLLAARLAPEAPPAPSGLALLRDELPQALRAGRGLGAVLLWCQPEPWPPASWRDEARLWPLAARLAAGERRGVLGCDAVVLLVPASDLEPPAVARLLAPARAVREATVWARLLAIGGAERPVGDGAWTRLGAAFQPPVAELRVAVPGQLFADDGPALGALEVLALDGDRVVARLAEPIGAGASRATQLALRGGVQVPCRIEGAPPVAGGPILRLGGSEAADAVSRALAAAVEAEIRAELARARRSPDA